MRDLLLGVIRNKTLYRANNAQRDKADAEYKAVRPGIMKRDRYQCVYCGYESRESNECHHLDGDHANNAEDNLVCVDDLCHATNHIGQQSLKDSPLASDGIRAVTSLAAIPELTQQDVNLLQRAIGAAMQDPDEAPLADQIFKVLVSRTSPVKVAFAHCDGANFAAGLARLKDDEYERREEVIGDLRVIFRPDTVASAGKKFLREHSALPFVGWSGLYESMSKRSRGSAGSDGGR